MRCSYHSIMGASGRLQTVGVMVSDGKRLVYKALPGLADLETERTTTVDEAMRRGWGAAEVFDYLVNNANGVTVDWSIPFAEDGDSAEDVASRLIKSIAA